MLPPMRTLPCMLTALLLACSGDKGSPTAETGDSTPLPQTTPTGETADTGEPQGACGDPVLYDLTLIGMVLGPEGLPSQGAHVQLEDRAWVPGDILGEGFTDDAGSFSITITGLTSLEDCWGLLDYNVEADKGIFYGEREANTHLFNAINDGTLIADMSIVPIELEEASR